MGVSAVLIVKDEEEVLGRCLAALAPFVDEVIVYDTGSTDTTREVASAHAAVVVEGYWDDDFAAARNRALAHARHHWVLSVDADEVIEGAPDAFRRWLNAEQAEAVSVPIRSISWGGSAGGTLTHGTRLFRRVLVQWAGALHEQPRHVGTGHPLALSSREAPVVLQHSGYTAVSVTEKNKPVRNLELARRARDAVSSDDPARLDLTAHLGRSLAFAGMDAEALEVLSSLIDHPCSDAEMVLCGRVAVPRLLVLERFSEVEAWATTAARHGESTGQIALWLATSALEAGDPERAERLIAPFLGMWKTGGRDLWGQEFSWVPLCELLAEIKRRTGRQDDARAHVIDLLERAPETVSTSTLFRVLGDSGLTMRQLIEIAPETYLMRSLREMILHGPALSLSWFTAYCAVHPGDVRPMVAGCAVAATVSVDVAIEWSLRAREAGFAGVCPVRDIALDESRSDADRAVAHAVLTDGFGEIDVPPIDAVLARLSYADMTVLHQMKLSLAG